MNQAELVTKLEGLKGKVVNILFNDDDEPFRCRLNDVFKSVPDRRDTWVVIVDNGRAQTFDVPTIKDVYLAE